MTATLARPDYRLSDALDATGGTVWLTGTQALVRLLLLQRQHDAAAGLATQGFLSGYRGSPLGLVDQAAWKAKERLQQAGVRFLPAVNEELAATAVLGTQRVEADPERTCDGVFAMWYGKGPGVDRAGDAIKHGNAYGSSPRGGVLVVTGDDHGCVSSSMPHQSDQVFQAWHLPVVSPANVAEILEFGLWGWQLSRFSGNWVGLTALSEVVESGSTVDLDLLAARRAAWQDAATVQAVTGWTPPPGGLHVRWPDLPSLALEERLHAKLDAVRAYARVNPIDRDVVTSPLATVGILTAGKAHLDFLEALRRLHLSLDDLAACGVRVRKLGLTYPIEPTGLQEFAQGLREMLVIEEKGPVVEDQLRALFYNRAPRPVLLGKRDAAGAPLLPAAGELRPSRLIGPLAAWLARHAPALDRRALVPEFTPPALPSNASDAVRRQPWFCAGCPHNTSTKVPEGSKARAGIGCHFMASWMDRDTEGLIQMGGEGVDWVSHAMFTRVPHVFQNLGDGTYYHSGYLAIRQAVAAGATMTYKILFNDAVAMTGGQPVDGTLTVDAIARQVEAEGAKQVVVVSDDIGKYAGLRGRFPAGTAFHPREDLDAVQRRLRETAGVTVLIYEQTCAAEKRRRRKKGQLADPGWRLVINERVCEGCGDCTVQSNCVAVLPHETPLGRKRRIDQSACNKDASCAQGFCPSFVTVTGVTPRKRTGVLKAQADAFQSRVDALPRPPAHAWDGPWDLLVTGVGGTGVVTVGALVAMAAHLEGRSASVLDFMGFAQKGGAVLSFVRLADRPERLHQVRIDAQQADALLACDLVVGASPEALATLRHGRTRVLANVHAVPVAGQLRDPDADLRVPLLLDKLQQAAGADRVETLDAQALAETCLGDTIASNILALGWAWQRGLVPVGLEAVQRAIALNGVAVADNQLAFSLGRLAAGDPQGLAQLLQAPVPQGREPLPQDAPLDVLVRTGIDHLTAYQDARYARRYADVVARVRTAEQALGADASLPLARTVARSLLKLMAIKDEYEVARLYTDGGFRRQLAEQFEGEPVLEFHLAPPLLARAAHGQRPRKLRFGPWLEPALRLLAHGKRLRGSWLDPFGHTAERRLERALLREYLARLDALLPQLSAARLPLACEIAAVPLSMRGYGPVKAGQVEVARRREAELLHRWDPARWPRPQGGPAAGQFKGIRVGAAA